VFAQNANPPGFQAEPIVRFVDADGDAMEFRYFRGGSPFPLWNDARGAWRSQTINIKSTAQPSTGWRGTAIGTPNWTRMSTVEIHADTWDSGFSLWFDRVGFNLPIVNGDYTNDQVVDGSDFLAWQRALSSSAIPPGSGADGDASGVIDAGDLAVWRDHFGDAPGALAAAQVAESTTASFRDNEQAPLDALYAAGDFMSLFAGPGEPERPKWRPRRR